MKVFGPPPSRAKLPGHSWQESALHFVEQGVDQATPHDVRQRLADFYKRNPLQASKLGQRRIAHGLKADRERR